jgi:plasmid stabilization system protein ParE
MAKNSLDAMAILIENKGGTARARKVRRELLAQFESLIAANVTNLMGGHT